jgi:hypothetical protein
MRRFGRAIALATSLTAGCTQIPHNDVVIFATNTKVALDIAPSPTAGNVPTFTLGYKREEGVWMPLVVNGQSSVPLSGAPGCRSREQCASVVSMAQQTFALCMQQPGETGSSCLAAALKSIKYEGREGNNVDINSVLASFGGQFGASGGGSAVLTQFFATGIAAQKLAGDSEISYVLSARDATSEEAESLQRSLRLAGESAIAPRIIAYTTAKDALVQCWQKDKATYASTAKQMLGTKHQSLTTALGSTDPNADAVVDDLLSSKATSVLEDFAPVNNKLCP